MIDCVYCSSNPRRESVSPVVEKLYHALIRLSNRWQSEKLFEKPRRGDDLIAWGRRPRTRSIIIIASPEGAE
jgi:hypothetical protein